MTAADNAALLRRYLDEVWGAGDPDAVVDFAAADYRRYGSPTAAPLDVAAQVERLHGFRRAFPDITIEVDQVVVDDEHIAFRGTLRGTHRGEFLGIAPTGRPVEVGLMDLIRVEDGRFAEHWGGPDMHDLVRQLQA